MKEELTNGNEFVGMLKDRDRRIAELEAEADRLRADGERLDWLIDQHGSGKNLDVMDCMADTAAYLCPLVSSEADDIQKWYRAAIDAARGCK